jgi:hypothetical protein
MKKSRVLFLCLVTLVAGLAGCDLFSGGGSSNGNGGGGGSLPAPTGVFASQNLYFDTVFIGWNAVSGAAKYQVSRSTSSGGPFTAIGTTTGTAAANTTTVPSSYPIIKGQHYFYQIAAMDSSSVAGTGSAAIEGWSNTNLFNDSFEDGEYGLFPTWGYRGSGGTSAWQVTSPGANSTSYALSYNGGSANGYWTQMDSGINPSYISFWVKVSSTTGAKTGELFCGDSSGSNFWSVRFYCYSDGKMYVEDYSGTRRGGASYSANTWYHVEIKNISWASRLYDFYVNGAAYATSVTMWDSAPANIATVDVCNESSTQAWWDELVMY